MRKLTEVQKAKLFIFTLFAITMTLGHIASVISCPPWREGEGLLVFGAGVLEAIIPGFVMMGIIEGLDRYRHGRLLGP